MTAEDDYLELHAALMGAQDAMNNAPVPLSGRLMWLEGEVYYLDDYRQETIMSKHTGRTFRAICDSLTKASQGRKVIFITNIGNESSVAASIAKMGNSFLSREFMTKSVRGEPPLVKFMMASGGTIEIHNEGDDYSDNDKAIHEFVIDVNDPE